MKEIVCKKFFLDGIPLTTYEVEDGNKKPVIYSFHGFDGYRDGDFYKREDVLARLGYFVVGFDSIMHGERRVPYFESKSYDEKMKDINQIIIQTAQDAILLFDKYLQYYPQVIKNEYYAMGFSMGGAITFYLASIDKRVKAIASIVGSPSLAAFYELKQQKYHWVKDETYQQRLAYYELHDPLIHFDRLKDTHIFMAGGAQDDVVPYHYAQSLHQVLPQNSVFKNYDTGHMSCQEAMQDAYDFLESVRKGVKNENI